ncbi:MAG: HAD family hydrolase [Nitrososphaeria archaeon]
MGDSTGSSGIRVLSVDLDGTVVDRGFAERFWMEFMPGLYARAKGIPLEEAMRIVHGAYNEVGPRDLRWYLPEYWLNRFGIDADPRSLILENAGWIRLYPDAKALLRGLGDGYRVVAATNSARVFAEVYEEVTGIRFSAILSCVSDFGIPRKNAKFYRRAAAVLEVEPGEILHVGDDPERDLRAALDAGVNAYLVDRNGCGGRARGRCVEDLRRILEILK